MSRGIPEFEYTVVPHSVGREGINGFVYDVTFNGLLVSQGHYRLPNGRWSGGGPFYVHKESLRHPTVTKGLFRSSGVGGTYHYGSIAGIPNVLASPQSYPSPQSGIDAAQAYGLRGYNATKPGRSLVETLVGGKEILTDGLPSLPFRKAIFSKKNRWGIPTFLPMRQLPGAIKRVLGDFRSLGSEYLNIIFGWKPFVKDLQDLYKAMKVMDREIAKLRAQNGHAIRRRATLLDDASTSQTVNVYPFAYANVVGAPPNFMPGGTFCTVTTTTKTKIWYSAGYRYWIPDSSSWQWDARARLALFGLMPTPGRLWDALPWSWFGDWFFDFGEIYEAVSPTAADNLVQLYGYTMFHDIYTVEAASYVTHEARHTEWFNPFFNRIEGDEWNASPGRKFYSLFTRERKIRAGGFNPFGPTVTSGTLNGRQVAILAALGLSKMP